MRRPTTVRTRAACPASAETDLPGAHSYLSPNAADR